MAVAADNPWKHEPYHRVGSCRSDPEYTIGDKRRAQPKVSSAASMYGLQGHQRTVDLKPRLPVASWERRKSWPPQFLIVGNLIYCESVHVILGCYGQSERRFLRLILHGRQPIHLIAAARLIAHMVHAPGDYVFENSRRCSQSHTFSVPGLVAIL